MMDYLHDNTSGNPVEVRACVAATGIPHGPTHDEWAAIRRTAQLPGGIDRTICGNCAERAWTMVPLSGLCVRCYGEWLDGRAV